MIDIIKEKHGTVSPSETVLDHGEVRLVDCMPRLVPEDQTCEFAIVQAGVNRPEDVAFLARRLIDAISEPYLFDGHTIISGACIGIEDALVLAEELGRSDSVAPALAAFEALAADALFLRLCGGMAPSVDVLYDDLRRFDDGDRQRLLRMVVDHGQ